MLHLVIDLLAEGSCIDAAEALFLKDQLEAAPFLTDEDIPTEKKLSLEEIFPPKRIACFEMDPAEPPPRYVM